MRSISKSLHPSMVWAGTLALTNDILNSWYEDGLKLSEGNYKDGKEDN